VELSIDEQGQVQTSKFERAAEKKGL